MVFGAAIHAWLSVVGVSVVCLIVGDLPKIVEVLISDRV
jgi:hypothetical protein